MHLFGEWVGAFALIIGIVTVWLSIHFIPTWRLERRYYAEMLRINAEWKRSYRKLADANAAILAELASKPALSSLLSEEVRQELVDARESARQIEGRRV